MLPQNSFESLRSNDDLESVFERFELAWGRGERPKIESLLPGDDESRHRALVELVHIELELRLKGGEAARCEEYFARFPDLVTNRAEAIALITSEFHQRLRREPQLAVADLTSRFPEHAPDLEQSLAASTPPAHHSLVSRVDCPHCHSTIQIENDSTDGEITCSSCGNSFRIEWRGDRSWKPEHLPNLGRFQLLELVGQGAFGNVYRAKDVELDRIVAIKVPRGGRFTTNDEEDRFIREGRNVGQLRHPGIVPVFEVGRSGNVPYLASEFVEGQTLSDATAARRIGFRDSAEIVAQAADALEHAHSLGVVHRDIKPSNLMIELERPHITVRVMDFGLARRDEGEITVTVDGQLVGTPAYMSPEQARGEGHSVSGQSDVYSLGVILFQLLTGELPFRGNKAMLVHQVQYEEPRAPRSLNDRIPLDLETITLKCIQKEPANRYNSAKELSSDLRRFLRGEPIQARRINKMARVWRWCRRNPSLSAASGLATISLFSALIIIAIAYLRESRLREDASTLAITESQSRGRAEKAEADVRLQKRQLQRTLTLSLIEQGISDPNATDRAFSFLRLSQAYSLAAEFPELRNSILALLEANEPPRVLKHGNAVSCVAFSADGTKAITASDDNTVRVWDATDGRPLGAVVGHVRAATAIAVSPDGAIALSGGADGVARFWDLSTGAATGRVLNHGGEITTIAFSRDSKQVITGSVDHQARLWDASTGAPIGEPLSHQGAILAAAFSPDGTKVITGSDDHTARIWSTATQQPLSRSFAHKHIVRSVAFSPDGRRVVTASYDGTAQILEVETGKAIGEPVVHD